MSILQVTHQRTNIEFRLRPLISAYNYTVILVTIKCLISKQVTEQRGLSTFLKIDKCLFSSEKLTPFDTGSK